jgi:hypothetical protein
MVFDKEPYSKKIGTRKPDKKRIGWVLKKFLTCPEISPDVFS